MSTKTNIWWISKASDFNGNILVLDEVGLVAAVTTADDARLIAAAPTMLEALRKLAAEVSGLRAFEPELRAEISNTNWSVLMQRLSEAEAAISSAQGEAS